MFASCDESREFSNFLDGEMHKQFNGNGNKNRRRRKKKRKHRKGVENKKMLKSKKFTKYFGIDRYSDHHDIKEYRRVIKDLAMQYPSYTLIRCDFDDALDIFPENFFDFIYVDGYAHTGENAGETIQSWYRI